MSIKRFFKILTTICIVCSVAMLLSGCNEKGFPAEENKAREDFFAMDTYMTITAYGKNSQVAVEKAKSYTEHIDNILSTGKDDSMITELNSCGKAEFSEDALEVLSKALTISRETRNAFNPMIYPLMELWGFPEKDYSVPNENSIKKTLPLVDTDAVKIEDNGIVTIAKKGAKVDLGGIAKGYTSSKIVEIFEEEAIDGGLICLGGNVQAMGRKPDGSLWNISIRKPFSKNKFLGTLKLTDKAVVTSGGYERYFEENGKKYHHILNPSTGYPANDALLSVTVVSSDGTLADGLSTALFVMGCDKAQEYWKTSDMDFDIILYTKDNKLIVSQGLKNIFSSDLKFDCISK